MAHIRPDIINVYTTSRVVEDLSPLAVTDVETLATFSTQRKSGLIYNEGPNDVHISFNTTVTTNNFTIPYLSSLSFVFPVTVIHFICAAGETCTLNILGER